MTSPLRARARTDLIYGFGLRVYRQGFRVEGFGFRVWNLGLRAPRAVDFAPEPVVPAVPPDQLSLARVQ